MIDGQIAYVGGINIVDDYDDLDPTDGLTAPRFDFAVKVRGPVVTDAAYAQDLLWVRLNWRACGAIRATGTACGWPSRIMSLWRLAARCAPRWCCATTCAFARPSSAPICWALPRRGATSLSPTPISFPACNSAAPWPGRRGVRVRLLLQGKVEYRMQYHATRSLYDQLLRDGIEIYEYMPGYLHAKVAVIDNVATVGSSNLDPFSLLLAREANVVIDDQPFAWDLQERLETAIREGGRFIRPLDYQRRGLLRRWVDAASYVLLRIGVALTGTSDKY